MKILWIVSFPLPEVAHLAGVDKSAFGGWVGTMLKQLSSVPDFQFSVAMKSPVKKLIKTRINDIDYYLMPQSKKDRFDIYQEDCEAVLKNVSPDLLHSEGTEGAFTLRFLQTWRGGNIVSIQGILNGLEPYEYGSLPVADMLLSMKLHKMLFSIVLISNKFIFFKKRMEKERQTIALADNIIGRTTYDRAHTYALNTKAEYHFCHHILRNPFYKLRWSYENVEVHSIFLGNAGVVRKGAHFLFYAVAQLKKEFPNIKIYITGEKPNKSNWKEWKKVVGYSSYLQNLIKQLDIAKNIEFLGMLQADEMAKQMSKAHLFVLSSAIENSPTTLSEAMLMGVPSITSYVGGTPDMAKDGNEALFYRDNDPQFLAYQIKRVFDDKTLALKLSKNSRKRALIDHDPQANLERMITIYNSIDLKTRK